jgi:hypothetical protein
MAAMKLPTGCAVCGTQNTVTTSLDHGRRCAVHSPFLTHLGYRRELAMELVDAGHPAMAFAYLRACLQRALWPRGRR